jgi:hypothetical protein
MKKNYTRMPIDQPHPAFKNEKVAWMPLLQVRVGHNHRQTPRMPAVVDSGSHYCFFQSSVGEYLGIDVEHGIEHNVTGITKGPSEPVYFHKVQLYVEADWIINVMAGFCKKLAVAAILGRNGFFDNFNVRFDHSSNPPVLEVNRIENVQ